MAMTLSGVLARLFLLFKQSASGASMQDATADRLIRSSVDVIVQLARVPGAGRRVVALHEVNKS